ncbi:MAG TPA: aminotransferase class I/II-fold pyridoxal phosphate-dependent enzyme [Virgibacillus sp.]|nr:aminotransferase class I/II-fold pyridoxal phosphate-dependent enzyme [Virgibacillus sp.]HLR68254.1 aminotransferase class I/II-fold pyridoxal phosphate-dependent enzyme [Virgibacillus sp.]
MYKEWNIDTHLIHNSEKITRGAITPSITPAVAYAFNNVDEAASIVDGTIDGTQYGRFGNPTVRLLEKKIATLEGGEAALALSSGMAAIATALLAFLKSGDHVVVTKDIYGGAYKFLTTLAPRFGIEVDFVDCTDLSYVSDSIKENTKALYLESPSNPHLVVLDIPKLSEIAHSHGIPVIIDNTFMTPYLQKPLQLGADIVVYSATKYLNGHGDVLAGFITGKSEQIEFMKKKIMVNLGQPLNAWEAFLILRGLKTLGVRLERHCHTAQKIAEFLDGHPMIEKVFYPGLKNHPQYYLAQEQMKGSGGVISFEVQGGLENGKKLMDSLHVITLAFSLGDPETLIEHPASMTHFPLTKFQRESAGITDGLIRLSVGLESVEDIIFDLNQALKRLKQS